MMILHAIEHLNTGGEEILLCGLVRALAAYPPDRVRQHVAVLKGGELLGKMQGSSVEVTDFSGFSQFGRLSALVGLIHKLRPDIIHTRLSSAGYWLRAAALLARSRSTLVHVHAGQTFYDAGLKRRALERFFDSFTSMHICVSESVRRHLLANGYRENKLTVIPNGIDSSEINVRKDRPFSQPAKLLCLGRLERVKGQDILLDALAALLSRGVGFRCDFAGDGSCRKQLEAQAKQHGLNGRAFFLGTQHNIASTLGDYDVFIQPSRSEGLSLALLEAMHAGLPVIATDTGDTRRATDGCVQIVPVNDVEALANAIASTLSDPRAALDKARQAQKRASQFSIESMAGLYLRTFQTCLSQRT